MKNPLISVIVPIYKVEDYLDECVQSIINQTYTNLEIILVDDESPDRCPEMCDEYARMDSRIKVIHKPNGGVSSARNIGIESSHGEWIYFLDSDDWIEPFCIEMLINKALEANVDLVDGNGTDMTGMCLSAPITNNQSLLNAFYSNKLHTEAWNRLIKSSIIKKNKLQFIEGHLCEDVLWGFSLASAANSLASIEQKTYNYRYRAGSIMSKEQFGKRYRSYQTVIFEILRIAKQNGEINNPKFTEWINYRMAIFFNDIIIHGQHQQAVKFYKKCIRKASRFVNFTRTDLHLLFLPSIGYFVYRKFFGCYFC